VLEAVWSEDVTDVGVECGAEIRRFARAAASRDAEAIAAAREPVRAQLGELKLSRAAGVAAFFDAINRVADATGVELEDYMQVPEDLGLERLKH
jgi:hypothetical protein